MNVAGLHEGEGALVGTFEADTWAGLVFVLGHERGLSLRLAVECDGHRIEPRDLFLCACDIGPCASDGRYARLGVDLTLSIPPDGQPPIRPVDEREISLTWEWARLDPHTVAIRISALRPTIACVEFGAPWEWRAPWAATASGIAGMPGAHESTRQPDIAVQVVEPRATVRGLPRAALPAFRRWHAWWQRRRRLSGLYAWGSTLDDIPASVPQWERDASHRQKAVWESGQDDLPNWDHAPWDDGTSTLGMD